MDISELKGSTLAGRFEIEELIGEGGYGAVFRGEQLSVGRPCAVKVLAPELCAEENTEERFRQEARTTSRLTHPNTVVLYDFGHDEEKSVLFLAMELLDGDSLKDRVEERGPMTIEETVAIVEQAAGSLGEAHRAGTVHRDIKPHNLMLVSRGGDDQFVKVIDFGIAKALQTDKATKENLTQTGMMIGTPAYMSPEQIRDRDIDGRSDQYSLAITTYHMLTGTTPFAGGTSLEVATRHLTKPAKPLSEIRGDIEFPEAFERVMLKALEKEPEDRFESIEVFAEALKTAAEGGTVEIPAPGERARAEAAGVDGSDASSTGGENDTPQSEGAGTLAVPRSEWTSVDESVEPGGDTAEIPETGDDDLHIPVESPRRPSTTAGTGVGGGDNGFRTWLIRAAIGSAVVLAGVATGWVVLKIQGDGADGREVASGERAAEESTGPARKSSDKESGGSGTVRSDEAEPGQTERNDSPSDQTSESASKQHREKPAGEGAEAETKENAKNKQANESDSEPESEIDETGSAAQGGSQESSGDESQSSASERGKEKEDPQEKEETDPEPVAPRPGSVVVRMIPWGTLYVGERKIGRGSRVTAQVPVGRHRLRMKQNGEVVAEKTVRVSPGEKHSIELVAP